MSGTLAATGTGGRPFKFRAGLCRSGGSTVSCAADVPSTQGTTPRSGRLGGDRGADRGGEGGDGQGRMHGRRAPASGRGRPGRDADGDPAGPARPGRCRLAALIGGGGTGADGRRGHLGPGGDRRPTRSGSPSPGSRCCPTPAHPSPRARPTSATLDGGGTVRGRRRPCRQGLRLPPERRLGRGGLAGQRRGPGRLDAVGQRPTARAPTTSSWARATPPNPKAGGYTGITNTGDPYWSRSGGRPAAANDGVQASLAVGTLEGAQSVVAPVARAWRSTRSTPATGNVLPGWPFFTADSGFTTPSLADLYDNGQTEVVHGRRLHGRKRQRVSSTPTAATSGSSAPAAT